jgi:hypothetical protein
MPELRPPDPFQERNLEQEPFKLGDSPIDDIFAINWIVKSYNWYDAWRRNNHDVQWNTNDAMYFGWVPQKYWEGTNIPRSSLGVPIVYDQIESAFPRIVDQLFGSGPYWFSVEAGPGGDPLQAAMKQAYLFNVLEQPHDFTGVSARHHLQQAIKQMLLYGNGGVEVGWDPASNSPFVEWVDLRDIYIDPNTASPLIDDSPLVIRRKMMTIEELEALRGFPGMRIPSPEVLNSLAKTRDVDQGDVTKQIQEGLRNVTWYPGTLAVNPAQQVVEVLVGWTRNRTIWVLGKKVCAYNEKNKYGFIPFCFAPYTTVVGRFYAQGIAHVLEGDQKYIQGLINGRLDEVSLALHPPRFRRRGTYVHPSALAWRPGLVDHVEDPRNDVIIQTPFNITQNAYLEVQLAEQRAQKRTGINDLTVMGTPSPSNANRTATGLQSQIGSTAARLQTPVQNVEDYLIVPMLYKIDAISQKFAPQSPQPGLAGPGNPVTVPREALNTPVKYTMLASSKMLTKDKLQAVFPFVAQYLLNPSLIDMAAQQGKKVRFDEVFRMLQDATGTKYAYQLMADMTPQEMQAYQQQKQQQMQMQMAKTQIESQTKMQLAQVRAQTEREKVQAHAQAKMHDTSEKSARDVLKTLVGAKKRESKPEQK